MNNLYLKLRINYFFLATVIYFVGSAQISYKLLKLPKSVSETSGLETYGDYLITHNDSGDKPKLYVISSNGKKIIEIKINNIENNDWEDITSDSDHFYIADTGNKYGTRENLKIYILNKNFILEGIIGITYSQQISYIKNKKSEFDAESLAVVGDELVLFSKNRKTLKSEIYVFPKKKGNYILEPKATINSKALITGADYDHTNDLMVLTGYSLKGDQFLFKINNFKGNGYKNLKLDRYKIPIENTQIEAIKIINQNEFWVSSESEEQKTPSLFRIKIESE